MPEKHITKVWTFNSSSSNKTYETLQYSDTTTSCNCPGWTQRAGKNNARTCKHVRLVDQGLADRECIASHSYDETNAPPSPAIQTIPNKKSEPKMKFKIAAPPRKIRWK